jgi:hypothetical protein
MTRSTVLTMIRLPVLWMLVLAATARAQDRPPIAEQIAKAHGLDSFGQIEQIHVQPRST